MKILKYIMAITLMALLFTIIAMMAASARTSFKNADELKKVCDIVGGRMDGTPIGKSSWCTVIDGNLYQINTGCWYIHGGGTGRFLVPVYRNSLGNILCTDKVD